MHRARREVADVLRTARSWEGAPLGRHASGGGYNPPATPRRRGAGAFWLVVVLLGALLALLAGALLGLSLAAGRQPQEVMYGEAIIHDQAARLRRGEPLYQPLDRPPYTVAAYTPLYYALAAVFQATFGPGFGPGRAVSFVAGLATAGVVAHLAARGTRDRRAGLFAALLFLALGLPWGPGWAPPWSALYKEDALGAALSLGVVATLAGGLAPGEATPRRTVLAGALAALALLTKQSLVAAPLAGTLWLWRHDRRAAARFAGVAAGSVLAVCGTIQATGGALVANTVVANVNPFSLAALAPNLATLATFQAGPLGAAGLWLLRRRSVDECAADGPVVALWLAALLPLLGLAKVGSNHNYWIELAAATAVLATRALWAAARAAGPGGRPAVLAPLVFLLLTPRLWTNLAALAPPAGLIVLPPDPELAGQFARVVDRVRAEPAEVLANPLDVIALAERPVLFEPYLFGILYQRGQWDPAPLVARICAGEVGLLVIHHPLEEDGGAYHGYSVWPAPVLAALRQTMALEAERAGRFLYAPALAGSRSAGTGAGCDPF